MPVTYEPDDGAAVITVTDRDLGWYNLPELRTIVLDLVNQGRYRVVIDLDGVAKSTTDGLGVLVHTLRRMERHGGGMALANVGLELGHLLRITGLDKTIPVADSVASALAMLTAQPEPAPVATPETGEEATEENVPRTLLAIASIRDGAPIAIDVIDARDADIVCHLVLPEWEEFRAASAGHRLIEHGYMILPSAHFEDRNLAGWTVLSDSTFIAPVRPRDQIA